MGPHSATLTDQPTHCVFLVVLDGHGSGLEPSCQPPLVHQLHHVQRSSGAFDVDGLKESLQFLIAEDAARGGVFGPPGPVLAHRLIGKATAGQETKKRVVPGDAG